MTITHAPDGYRCPMCDVVAGRYSEHNQPSDLVADRDTVFALVSPKWWPNNPGGVLVVPREHHENIYDIPRDVGHELWDLTQDIAVRMRETYGCSGITVRQHNEPDGNQDMWHLHIHVIPRHHGDNLYSLSDQASWHDADSRKTYADKLRGRRSDQGR
ncbi:MAG TPA: HIT family protein [Candidatus Corynebacterium avicola]|uniref:HIT family protein n=1 Tax=Candidatus Corynebacterium avicola TaxID=2838527 RepID=A0A9D1UN35_9CORY|nr:HIT family protein [Candidatus Corynebacterium avicola]